MKTYKLSIHEPGEPAFVPSERLTYESCLASAAITAMLVAMEHPEHLVFAILKRYGKVREMLYFKAGKLIHHVKFC